MTKRFNPQMVGGEQLDLFADPTAQETQPAAPAGPAVPLAPVTPRAMSAAEAEWVSEYVVDRWTDANDTLLGIGPLRVDHMADGCQRTGKRLTQLCGSRRRGQRQEWFPIWLADDPHLLLRTTVVCLKGRRDDPEIRGVVYVGRPMYQGGWQLHGHPLANPFKVGKDGTAAEVVAKYDAWLDAHPKLLARELPRLRGKRLGCWCAKNAPCHARVLAERANAAGVTS